MSLLDLRVELPTYSLSFQIHIPQLSTIRDVKQEIQRSCPGFPRVDGQRVIWRGRLLKDDEKVLDIWKSPNDSRVVHLSVHPSAWVGTPPSAVEQQPSTPATQPHPSLPSTHQRPHTAPVMPSPPSQHSAPGLPLPYVAHQHNNALHILMHGKPLLTQNGTADLGNLTEARSFAMSVLHAHGLVWPRVLDEDYPPVGGSLEGIKYERVIIDNCPFLSLTTPDGIPTPCQTHALNVLRTTYALLSIPTPELTSYPSIPPQAAYQVTPNTNLNHHLQQLGMPALRLAPNQNPNQNPVDPNNPLVPEIRAFPIRALMVPLMMLTFRTLLLMYFFSPSKRPLFGLILSLWILYEAWNAFRVVLGGGARPGLDRDGVAGRGGAGDDGGLGAGQGPNARPGAQAQPTAGPNRAVPRSQMDSLLDSLGNFQLLSEEMALVGDHHLNAIPAPSMFHRVKAFCALLLTTLHPAVWDRRRTLLRRREGRMRGEADVRTSEANDQDESPAAAARRQLRTVLTTRHERRPGWVKQYIERVLTTEWADDL